SMTGPGGQYYGFADSITNYQPAASYAGLAALFDDPKGMTLAAATKSSAYAPLQLIFRDPSFATRTAAPAPTPLQNTFMAAGVTSMTGSRTDTRASYAAFRFGSDPAGSHQHFDGGDFDFQALGQEWAVDLGMETGTYDLLAEDRSSTRFS
ncbi:heparinase II/III family protein, partial [Pseudomonas aeruginosa]|uniref:heparinase II/III family protein n=1 Tax=Pseudomonas aeruginosa TaxID=287 RepID=UPI0020951890